MSNKIIVDPKKLALAVGKTAKHITLILQLERFPGRKLARVLEKETGIHRLHWLYPDEFNQEGERTA